MSNNKNKQAVKETEKVVAQEQQATTTKVETKEQDVTVEEELVETACKANIETENEKKAKILSKMFSSMYIGY